MGSVRILNGALDEHDGRIILRGALDHETLEFLLVDSYQREIRGGSSLNKIKEGYASGSAVPDVELGMRGTRKSYRDGVYILHDPVYIIDGLQRITAAKQYLTEGKIPHLGAVVHFGTDEPWERRQFAILNAARVRVSSNVLFRNIRHEVEAVEMLIAMCEDSAFVLRGRVNWGQGHGRSHLINGLTLGKAVTVMHSHLTGVTGATLKGNDLALRLKGIVELVGKTVWRANIRTFFDLIEECWGMRRIAYADKAPQIRVTFLLSLAKLLSNHEVFWRDNRLLIEAPLRRKLAGFKIRDPYVDELSGKGTSINLALYNMIVDHINSGKRTQQLRPRTILGVQEETPANGEGDSSSETADE